MASEGSRFAFLNSPQLPLGLLALALVFALVTFLVGWFAVTTRIQIWEYDSTDPEGKGDPAPYPAVRIHTEFELLRMNSRVAPEEIGRQLENLNDLPSYDNGMDRTGSKMLGLFLLNLVAFASLAGVAGFYFWNRKSRRNFVRSIWRYTSMFAAFAAFAVLYLYSQVPPAAEEDTRAVLSAYESQIRPNGFDEIEPTLLQPEVGFWKRWICCPPDSYFQNPQNNQLYLVVVTTESRPSAGFWLTGAEAVLVGAAMILGNRTGQLGNKEPDAAATPELYPTYKAA